jgi:hypothetical protein
MFSPLLIPAKFYRNKFQKTSYEHKLKEPLTLSILKTYNKPKGENALPISHFEEMREFRKTQENYFCNNLSLMISCEFHN